MQMLIDSGLADTQAAGNLLEGDTVAEVLHDDVTADGWLQLVNALIQGYQFFFEFFRRCDGRVKVKEVEAFHPFLNLTVTHHVQASVSYACKQIGLGCLLFEVAMTKMSCTTSLLSASSCRSMVASRYI